MVAQVPSAIPDPGAYAPVAGADEWFEIRALGDGTYLIAEPGHVNCFLVTGERAALLFDTGLGIAAISQVVRGLTDRPLIVINSHDHLDHRGGNADLVRHRDEVGLIDIAAHPLGVRDGHGPVDDASLRTYETAMRGVYDDYAAYMELDTEHFFAASRLPRMRPVPELSGWQVPQVQPTRALADGETIDLGGRSLTVHYAPGHSPDGLCVFEAGTGTLLAGDTILAAAFWMNGDGADLGAFVASATRLAELPVRRVLTPHNLVAEHPGSYVADVVRAARAVLDGEDVTVPAPRETDSP